MPPKKSTVGYNLHQEVDDSRLYGQAAPPFKDPQHEYQLRQVFAPKTWIMDLVCFSDDSIHQNFWYVFFVEANTRYLVVIPVHSNVWLQKHKEKAPKLNAEQFLNLFQKFEAKIGEGKIYKIIGDFQRQFWSGPNQQYYASKDINVETINTVVEGHTRLAILDRIVRTIKGYIKNHNARRRQSEEPLHPTPYVLNQLVTRYNNRRNSRLRYTPKQLHENPNVEQIWLLRHQARNFYKKRNPGYVLPTGANVQVRVKTKEFGKEKLIADPDSYTIVRRERGGLYTLDRDGERIQKWRRDIRLVPQEETSQ